MQHRSNPSQFLQAFSGSNDCSMNLEKKKCLPNVSEEKADGEMDIVPIELVINL